MYLALIVAATPLVSGGFFRFPLARDHPANDDMRFVADFMNDMNMDISFNDRDMREPFAPLLNFPGPQAPPPPLYLMVDRQQQQPGVGLSTSMFVLDHTDHIHGNTHRYTVRSDDGKQTITETWSSKPSKMFLCSDKSCGRDSGMEVMNILDQVLGDMQARHTYREAGGGGGGIMPYMHLVPTSTVAAQLAAVDDQDANDFGTGDQYEAYDAYQSYMQYAMDTMRGCHHRMKQMVGGLYGDDGDEAASSQPEIEIIFSGRRDGSMRIVGGDGALDFGDTESEIYVDEAEYSEILFAFHVLTSLCLLGGVMFLCIAFCMRRKSKQTPKKKEMEGFVRTEETDQFTMR